MYYWIAAELLRPALTSRHSRAGICGRVGAWPTSSPGVDVPALTALLDGKYVDVRNLVRKNLAQHAGILEDAGEPRHRRATATGSGTWSSRWPATGQTGIRLPRGVRRRRRHRRVGRGLRDPRLRRPVGAGQGRRAVRAVRRRDPPARHQAAPRRLPRRPGRRPADGLLRDDRDRARLQRAGPRHHRDVRRGDAGVRHPHARRRLPQGLHRQRRPARRRGGRLRPARDRRRPPRACTRSSCRCATEGARCCPAYASRTAGRRWASTASTTAGSGSTSVRVPREALLNQFADVSAEGAYSSAIENPNRRFFTMLGTLVQGRVCVGGAVDQRGKVALTIAIRYADRRRQFEATSERGAAAARLRHAPAPAAAAAGADLRAALRAGGGRRRPARRCSPGESDDGARPPGARVAGGRHQGARHLARHPHHPGVPRGVRRRGLPLDQPVRRAQGRHRRVHHLRGRQPRPAAAGRQGAAHRLLQRLLRPRPVRDGAVRGRDGRRDRGRADQRAQAARADPRRRCPAATSGTRRPGCSTRTTSWRCSASARSTCWPAWPAGSSAASTPG